MSRTPYRLLAGVSACFAMLLSVGCYNMNGYVMNASGHGYYEQGNYAMAAREFQSALASNPYNPDYIANLAKTRQKMGDPNSAQQLFQQALVADPSHQPSYHGLAELMLAQGRGDEANRLLNTWAATQPYVAESHVELAWLQREMGQTHAAANTLKRALQVNPSHSTALAHLGQYYQETGQPAQAISMYQQSLQSNWNQPEVHSQIAVAAERAGTAHPMGEMAMSRGVHPQSLARHQELFGNNPPGLAFQPPVYPNTFASASAIGQNAGFPQHNIPQIAAAPPSFANGTTSAFMPPAGPGIPQQFTPPIPTNVDGSTLESVSIPTASAFSDKGGPTPDPAFSEGNSGIPATTISQSTTTSDIAEVEAF